jgi:hypothetical protein
MLKIYSKKILTHTILFITISISRLSPKYKIVNYLFDFFKHNCRDLIYFISYKNKNKIINYLKKRQNIEKKELVNIYEDQKISSDMQLVLNDLNNTGISQHLKIEITDKEINNFVEEMSASHFYDSHVPIKKNRKNPNTKPLGAYKSYDYLTQLNNPTLLKLCINEKIIKVAEQYLGVIPKIFSINTFNTLSGQKAFTHDFHRDIDNIKWLVVFIYWTNTSLNDGAFEQIKFTHKPSPQLENLLKENSKIFSTNFKSFFKKTAPGYDQNDNYMKLFKNEISSFYGKAGTVVTCDTLGLHRGTPVKQNRLVTWIRYGVIESRQKIINPIEILDDKIMLNSRNMDILNNSKFKDVLSDIVKIN